MSREELVDEVVGLRLAMQSRAQIEQAKGLLMERHAIGSAQAWEVLRTASNNANRKLRDVAGDLVADAEVTGQEQAAVPSSSPGRVSGKSRSDRQILAWPDETT